MGPNDIESELIALSARTLDENCKLVTVGLPSAMGMDTPPLSDEDDSDGVTTIGQSCCPGHHRRLSEDLLAGLKTAEFVPRGSIGLDPKKPLLFPAMEFVTKMGAPLPVITEPELFHAVKSELDCT